MFLARCSSLIRDEVDESIEKRALARNVKRKEQLGPHDTWI